MKYDVDEKLYYYENLPILKFLKSGDSYTEIANKHFFRNKNKVIYIVRKLMRELGLRNREQLVNFAIINELV